MTRAVIFTNLRSSCVKGACKMLMKLTPDVRLLSIVIDSRSDQATIIAGFFKLKLDRNMLAVRP